MPAKRTVNIEKERDSLQMELSIARKLVKESWVRSVGNTSLRKLEEGLVEVHERVTKRLRALRRLERNREKTDKRRGVAPGAAA